MKRAHLDHCLKLKQLCFNFKQIFTATLLAVFCVPANAGFKLEFNAGMEYDSNVATDDADTDVGLGDVARNLSLGLAYDYKINKHWNLSSAYRLNDTQWNTYDQFDSQMHIGVFRLGYQKEKNSSDISLIHAYGSVDGEDFLSLNRLSPALAYLINTHWYIRAQSDFSQKTFARYEQRNGSSLAASLYLYRFIDRTRFYVIAQAQVKQENANESIYAYQASVFKLQLKRDWELFNYKGTSRLKGRYEKRQYEGVRAAINAAREDERWRLALQNSLNISKRWQITSSLQSDYFYSNVTAANYRQERIQLGLTWEF
ncbi:MAG: hypothetical protein CMI14_04465 [Oleispira sp.]|nr:hypothetical protein [Oleispira sp.]|tara:strand:+ start:892 stop:1833 length:942 start_codon:yes stop_codon:yes gene_type:complete